HRADSGDRAAQGARRAPDADPDAVRDRGGVPGRLRRRHRRSPRVLRLVGRAVPHLPRPGAALGGWARHRRLLRRGAGRGHLSGLAGLATGPGGRAARRVERDRSGSPRVRERAVPTPTRFPCGSPIPRLGHAGSRGEFQANTRRAVEYVMVAVERAPADQVAVQDPGTLPQRKLGRNIDTYVAAQFISEALPTLPRGLRGRAEAALA